MFWKQKLNLPLGCVKNEVMSLFWAWAISSNVSSHMAKLFECFLTLIEDGSSKIIVLSIRELSISVNVSNYRAKMMSLSISNRWKVFWIAQNSRMFLIVSFTKSKRINDFSKCIVGNLETFFNWLHAVLPSFSTSQPFQKKILTPHIVEMSILVCYSWLRV